MAFDIRQVIAANRGHGQELYARHVNPRFARALKIIGFDREYVRGQGAYLWDDQGRRYLDMLAGYGVFNIGRNHPAVIAALKAVMDDALSSLVQMETPLLCGVAGGEIKARVGFGLDHVYFCSTGAEANETAIKFARKATGRPTLVYASHAFHGLTTGALALNGSPVFRDGFGPLRDTREVPFGDIEALAAALAAGDVAAFVVEPIQGKGVNIPPPGYLAEAARLCRRHGALFIADEVQTGVGRSGRFLALHHEDGVRPDMVLLSKALSGGFVPVACVVMSAAVYNAVFSSLDRAVVHSSTFGKSNFAMTALLAALAALDEDDLIANTAARGEELLAGLSDLAGRYEFIHDVRGRGLMIAVEFGRPRSLKLRTAWNAVNKLNADLFCQAITIPLLADHGILTQVAGHAMTTIKLIPPLTVDADDIATFLAAFEQVMDDLHRFPGPVWESLTRIARNAVAGQPRHTRRAGAE